MTDILMPKATAVWLVDNTSLTFEQIAAFCGLHPLEVKGIADGEVARDIRGADPIANGQLSREELDAAQNNAAYLMKAQKSRHAELLKPAKKAPRYTPVSRRQDRPDAIAWFLRHHPEVTDAQISKLIGTTKSTIQAIRERTHWNINNITPIDPVALGLCKQSELDSIVQAAARKKAAEGTVMTDDERRKLVSTEQSLAMGTEGKIETDLSQFARDEREEKPADFSDADSFLDRKSVV